MKKTTTQVFQEQAGEPKTKSTFSNPETSRPRASLSMKNLDRSWLSVEDVFDSGSITTSGSTFYHSRGCAVEAGANCENLLTDANRSRTPIAWRVHLDPNSACVHRLNHGMENNTLGKRLSRKLTMWKALEVANEKVMPACLRGG